MPFNYSKLCRSTATSAFKRYLEVTPTLAFQHLKEKNVVTVNSIKLDLSTLSIRQENPETRKDYREDKKEYRYGCWGSRSSVTAWSWATFNAFVLRD
jgi:hypothetical protein